MSISSSHIAYITHTDLSIKLWVVGGLFLHEMAPQFTYDLTTLLSLHDEFLPFKSQACVNG